MLGHVVAQKTYFLIFGALLLLTALTTSVAFVDLGQWNTIVALTIACCKATLVVLFFMHLRWSTRLIRAVLLSALLWLAILIGLTTTDFVSRDWTPVPQTWESSMLQLPDRSGDFVPPSSAFPK
jgi:cytochrome c oxidase subunit 4